MVSDFRIVTLCGSSGALHAYVEILRSVPADSGMAYVVLTHRRRLISSRLVNILSRATRMHVEEIVHGTVLQPNRVYTMPAASDVSTDGRALWLSPSSKPHGWPNVFDLFLSSVACHTQGRAVTVILSGLGMDGSAALDKLKESGGFNYAQKDPESASMPRSAIETGNVDYIGSPREIAAAILKLAVYPR
jgi:two-component system, chemotaxis family, protein-glutamate methylesterase/glutaminase